MNYQITALTPGLYLVATPIGTARDITLRALDLLASADILVAEDTRTLRHLMSIHAVPLNGRIVRSFHDHSKPAVRDAIMADVTDGKSVVYASEAGTPMVSDPGYELVREAIARELPVTGAPGPSAAIAALVVSGLPTDRFLFLGFLPNKVTARRKALAEVAGLRATTVIYEAPGRVGALLDAVAETCGPERPVVVCRELTKRFEEVLRGSVEDIRKAVADRTPKGECVVLVGPAPDRDATEDDIADALRALPDTLSVRDAAAEVAKTTGAPRNRVYKIALALKNTDGLGQEPS